MGLATTDIEGGRAFADLAGDLSMILVAINEREECIGATQTAWTMPDGVTTKAKPTAADLSGYVLGGDGLKNVLIAAQDALVDLVDGTTTGQDSAQIVWVNGSGVPYTDAGIQSTMDGLGYGQFTETFNWWDSRVWHRLQFYVLLLLYCQVRIVNAGGTVDSRLEFDDGDPDFDTQCEEAWDNARAATPSSQSVPILFNSYLNIVFWRVTPQIGGPFGDVFAQLADDATVTFQTDLFKGVISDCVSYFGTEATDYLSGTVSFSYAGTTYTCAAGETNDEIKSHTAFTEGTDWSVSASISTSEPVTNPFVRTGADNDTGYVTLYMRGKDPGAGDGWYASFSLDISGEVSD